MHICVTYLQMKANHFQANPSADHSNKSANLANQSANHANPKCYSGLKWQLDTQP